MTTVSTIPFFFLFGAEKKQEVRKSLYVGRQHVAHAISHAYIYTESESHERQTPISTSLFLNDDDNFFFPRLSYFFWKKRAVAGVMDAFEWREVEQLLQEAATNSEKESGDAVAVIPRPATGATDTLLKTLTRLRVVQRQKTELVERLSATRAAVANLKTALALEQCRDSATGSSVDGVDIAPSPCLVSSAATTRRLRNLDAENDALELQIDALVESKRRLLLLPEGKRRSKAVASSPTGRGGVGHCPPATSQSLLSTAGSIQPYVGGGEADLLHERRRVAQQRRDVLATECSLAMAFEKGRQKAIARLMIDGVGIA